MVVEQAFMLGQVVGLNRKIRPIHRLRALGRAKKINEGLRFFLRGKPAESMFRHAGGGMPEGQVNRTALVDAQGPVPDLESIR